YPKLLVAVPFTPVPGSRLLARDERARSQLVRVLGLLAREHELSSIHVLFGDAVDEAALNNAGWMARSGVQFHWQANGHASFAEFLAALTRDKRKKIQQEQRRVRDAGVSLDVLRGETITKEDWDFFHRCYELTYAAHGSTPYLSREFFAAMARNMTAHWLMFVARRDGLRIACSLVALDPAQRHAFGRYWGAVEHVPCLHFDACYYQPLAWCMANGYQRFEGGAQGEHKMARGLLPVATRSSHWLAHPEFRAAVGDFLAREGRAMDDYVSELGEHQPFKPA
ncbi:MAG: N-acetyltransferase, partial [Paucibacter sp.]|nr:N-acetyltransferase [Roseateles sp.]